MIEQRGTDNPNGLASLSPFVIQKGIKGYIGSEGNIKKLRSGALLVEVTREPVARNLLKMTTFVQIPVTVSAHRSLNFCKGVIRSHELSQMNEADLLHELEDQGVTAVKVITQKREGQIKNTRTIILTFAKNHLPDNIKAGYMNIKVEPYIPNPLRCFNCQKFGHHQTTCRQRKTCAKCGLADHDGTPCSNPPKCVNCGGDHPSFFNTCPVWKTEKEICKEKAIANVTYPVARQRVAQRSSLQPTSILYSAAATAKPSMISIATQTDVTNCKCIAPPTKSIVQNKQSTNTQTDHTQSNVAQQSTREQNERGNKQNIIVKQHSALRTSSLSPRGGSASAHNISKDKSNKSANKGASSPAERTGRTKDRPQKGSADTVQSINKFAPLEDYEMSDPPLGAPSGKISLKKIVGPQ
jgi:hypothetical protein